MIYTGVAVKAALNVEYVPFMTFMLNYKPQVINIPESPDEQVILKTNKILGFISGEMAKAYRSNANMISRDVAVIDLDDVTVSETALIETIERRFISLSYVLYPTPSNGIKGVRYRLCLPLSEPVDEQQYNLLIRYISEFLLKEVIGVPDKSNTTFSQLQGLPVITQKNKIADIIVHNTTKLFPTQEALSGAKEWWKLQQSARSTIQDDTFASNTNRFRNKTTFLFEDLVNGCGTGNRNNQIASITGRLLLRNVEVAAALELVRIANAHFDEPLDDKEVYTTFVSIARKELSKI
jgi:hypothetical protein